MLVYCWHSPHCTINSLASYGTATTLSHGRSESHLKGEEEDGKEEEPHISSVLKLRFLAGVFSLSSYIVCSIESFFVSFVSNIYENE